MRQPFQYILCVGSREYITGNEKYIAQFQYILCVGSSIFLIL